MDKIFEKFFGLLDAYSEWVDNTFFPKPKKKNKKKKRCKNCHCNCHCNEALHSHHYDGDLCTCEGCKH